jgi:hypothetical protein
MSVLWLLPLLDNPESFVSKQVFEGNDDEIIRNIVRDRPAGTFAIVAILAHQSETQACPPCIHAARKILEKYGIMLENTEFFLDLWTWSDDQIPCLVIDATTPIKKLTFVNIDRAGR